VTDAQRYFLALHVTRLVERWQWFFSDSMLRAFSARQSATVSRAELNDLVFRGFVTRSYGDSIRVTDAGREQMRESA
jgi:hypothetical protein